MKKIGALILMVVCLMCVCCARTAKVREPNGLVKHIGGSTVALVWQTDKEVKPFCTGTWVGKDEILTAHHCVQAMANEIAGSEELDVDVDGVKIHYIVEGEVEGVGEEPSGIHLGRVVADDGDHDLALIRAVGKVIPAHEVAVVGSISPGVGEKVYLTGQVIGLYWTHIEGIVAAHRDSLPSANLDIKGPFIQLSAPVYFGNSGGGIFDGDGKLVGVVSFMMRAPMTNFGIGLESVKGFLKKAHS